MNDGVGRLKRREPPKTTTAIGGCDTLHPPYSMLSLTVGPLPNGFLLEWDYMLACTPVNSVEERTLI